MGNLGSYEHEVALKRAKVSKQARGVFFCWNWLAQGQPVLVPVGRFKGLMKLLKYLVRNRADKIAAYSTAF